MAERIRVVTAADDQLALRRMAAALTAAAIGPAVQAAGTDEAAAAASAKDSVVAVVCDVSDPARMAALRRLRKAARGALIVAVSPQTDATGVRRALEAGADGLVFESEIEDSLAPCVAAVAAGQSAVPRRVRSGLHRPAFSARERQVLGHVATGLTNREIADALFLSESTVKCHLSSAFAKLGVHSRKEAAALVLDPGQGLDVDLLATGLPALAGARDAGRAVPPMPQGDTDHRPKSVGTARPTRP
jgi:DNA-binding NarL/FixJ family response regulator